MFLELKRSIFNKWFVLTMIIVFCFSFLSAYLCGWRTALSAPAATDLNDEGVRFLTNYYGNTFRVWTDSFQSVQMLLPVLVGIPYLLTYFEEKQNGFRNYVVSRKGLVRYVFQKTICIAFAGSFAVTIGQALFYSVSYFMTVASVDKKIVGDMIDYNTSLFYRNPYLYFFIINVLRFIYCFALAVFSIGLTSCLKVKAVILTLPFVLVAILDIISLSPYTPYETSVMLTFGNATIKSFTVYVICLIMLGVIGLIYSERKRRIYG